MAQSNTIYVSTWKQTYNGFSKDELCFLKEVPDEVQIECPICLQVMLKDPHLVSCCGHHFCGPCIERSFSRPCPLCKSANYKSVVNKGLLRTINGLRVYCINQTEGCEWLGDLKDLDRHLNTSNRTNGCQYVEVTCLFNCSAKIKRHLLEFHEKTSCPYRPFSCKYCGKKGTCSEIKNVHYQTCLYYPIQCPNQCHHIGKGIPRSYMDDHLQQYCPKQPVECEYSSLGCKVELKREDLPDHRAAFATEHNTLIIRQLMDICISLQNENKVLKKDLEQTNSQIENIQIKICQETNDLNEQTNTLTKDYMNCKFIVRIILAVLIILIVVPYVIVIHIIFTNSIKK